MPFETLKTKQDFDFVYKNAKRVYARCFVLYLLRRQDTNFFLGLSVSKKVGNACQRNLIKRRFRSLCALHISELTGISLIVVPKQGILDLTYQEMQQEFLKGLRFFGKHKR